MNTLGITLNRHILDEEHKHPGAVGELSRLLVQVGFAAKILAREITRAALVGELGLVGEKNATGDAQKKLDVFANDTVVEAFVETEMVAGIVSEELDELKYVSCGSGAKYILCIDPLDGSSNTDINGAVGSIFGIYRRSRFDHCDLEAELLRQGATQIAAGYVMYGTSTILVYTCGQGVYGFTLDRDLGEFLLSHPNIRCPSQGRYFSANMSHFNQWNPEIQEFVRSIPQGSFGRQNPYSFRYAGALVADLHRNLLEGGLYLYPADTDHREGKLRLLYECAPLAFVVEQAGGRASTGKQRVLDIQTESIHQRTPFVVGSSDDVTLCEQFLAGKFQADGNRR